MKWILILVAVSLVAFSSCKCCQKNKKCDTAVTETKGAATGTVSHQFRATGCKTVILVSGTEDQILIPVEGLPEALDVDGKIITFDFNLLRMPQPEGCDKGQPAQLSNVCAK